MSGIGNDTFTVTVSRDGDQWCALKGENLQEGLAGFGATPFLALVRLTEEINEIEMKELGIDA